MKLRIRMISLDNLNTTQPYLVISLNSNEAFAFTRPGVLEYLDGNTWIPVPIDLSALESKQTEHVREVPGEVPVQVPAKDRGH